MPKRCTRTIAIFGVAALLGPLLAVVATPGLHTRGGGEDPVLSRTMYDLTLMLWPAQILALAEHSWGTLARWAAVAGNVILFAILGACACRAARNRTLFTMLLALVLGAVVVLSLAISGFDSQFFRWMPLALALALYAALFWAAARAGRGAGTT